MADFDWTPSMLLEFLDALGELAAKKWDGEREVLEEVLVILRGIDVEKLKTSARLESVQRGVDIAVEDDEFVKLEWRGRTWYAPRSSVVLW